MDKNIDLKTFLKTYTAISNKFINELCEKEKHGINAELVIKYLDYKDSDKFYESIQESILIILFYIVPAFYSIRPLLL